MRGLGSWGLTILSTINLLSLRLISCTTFHRFILFHPQSAGHTFISQTIWYIRMTIEEIVIDALDKSTPATILHSEVNHIPHKLAGTN